MGTHDPVPDDGGARPHAEGVRTDEEAGRRTLTLAGVVQVLAGEGTVAGAGFLVGETTAVTCAHVAHAAGAGPGDQVELVFPHLPGAPRTVGQVLAGQWEAPGEQDVAFVRLQDAPAQARALAVGSAAHCRGHQVYAFGFPGQAPPGGHFGYGRAGDLLPGGRAGQLLQLYEANDVATGFSGGPVLDEVTGLVIGMVTSITAPDAHLKGLGLAYATPTEVLRQVRPDLTVQHIQPYRGLEPFTAAHTRFFFGRDDAVGTVLAELGRQRRLLLLLGPSGAGKSSLIQAGVLPALARAAVPGSDRWLTLLVRPGQDLANELERVGLPGAATHGLASAVQRRLADDPAHDRLLLVLDQFEELLTHPATAAPSPASERRKAALDDLVDAAQAHTPCSILLIMRDDFYPRLAASAPQILKTAAPALLNIPATLTLSELRAIITRPAQDAGARLETGLAERIIADIRAAAPDGQAPVTLLPPLELALEQLWQRLRDGQLTHHAYQHIGAVTGSLTTWCNTAINQLAPEYRPTAQRLLTALVRPADESLAIPATRQQVPLERLRALATDPTTPTTARDAAFDTVLATLTRHRVITTRTPPHTGDTPDTPTAELIHDALLRDWSDLRDWTAQDHRFQLWLHRTAEQAERHAHSGLPADLLAGSDLEEGLDWARQRALPTDTTTFLTASKKQQQTVIRRARRISIILAGLLVLALIATGIAFWQRQNALDAQREAQSRQLAAQASALFTTNPDLASLLSIAAYRTSPTREATTILYAAADLPIRYRLPGGRDDMGALVFSPNGHTLASAVRATVRLWDPQTGRLLHTLPSHKDDVYTVAFSPDGRTLASDDCGGRVRLWDPKTGRLLHTLPSNKGPVCAVAFSPDGRTLASGGGADDGRVRLWDPKTGRLLHTLPGHQGSVCAVAFSPDGRTLASGGADDGRVRLWDSQTGRLLHTFSGAPGAVPVAFSSNGRTLVGGGADGRVRFWDPKTGRLLRTFPSHQDGVYTLAFSSDGHTLASGDIDGVVRLWDSGTGRLLRTFPGHQGAVSAVAFSSDGRTLASGGFDGVVRLWDPSTGLWRTTPSRQGEVWSVAFSSDGRTLASGGEDGTVWLWTVPAPGQAAAIDKICRSIGRDLTKDEKTAYLTGQSTRPVCSRVKPGSQT